MLNCHSDIDFGWQVILTCVRPEQRNNIHTVFNWGASGSRLYPNWTVDNVLTAGWLFL